MKLEKITKKDSEKIWELEALSFGMQEKARRIFNKEISSYKGYKVEQNNKVASAVFFSKRMMHFNDKIIKTGTISYVATLPEFRNKGYIKEIFKKILLQLRKDGYILSSLYALKIEYYKKFGYETVSQSLTYTIKPEIIPSYKNEKLYDIKYIKNKNYADYVNYYNKNIYNRFNGMYKKTVANEKIIDDWMLNFEGYSRIQRCLLLDKNGNIKGIFTFTIKRDGEEEQKVRVYENFFEDRKGYETFLNYIGNFRDQAKEITVSTYLDDRFEYLLNTLYFKKEIKTRQMARILNMEEFLKKIKLKNGSYQITVNDDIIHENNGTFTIVSKNNRNTIKKVKARGVGMDISRFVQLIFLDDALKFFSDNGFLTKNDVKFFENIKDKKPSFVTEFF